MTQVVKKRWQQFTDLLSKEQTHIVQTAFILMIPAVLTKISGQIFNLLAASYFGTEDVGWNQFIVANAIPELLTNVFLIGAVGSIIIPILISAKKEGQEAFYRVYSSTINVSIVGFLIVSVLLFVGAEALIPRIIELVASDTGNIPTPDEYARIANMMRVLLIPQLILGTSVFISNGINVYDRFLVPTLAPLFFNIGRIVSLVIFVPLLDKSPWAVVIGTIVGSLFHLAIQIPLYNRLDLKWLPVIDLQSPYTREVALLGAPRMFALASEYLAFTFNKFLAFGISTGSSAALFYANSLSLVIPTLFGYTFSYASYPTLSRLFDAKKLNEVKQITQKTLQEILFLALPFTMIFAVLRLPIVRLTYGLLPNTNFSLDATYQVSWILLWFSLGWVFVSGRWFMYRLFYAAKNTIIPLIVASSSLAITVGLSLLFVNLFSHNETYAITDTVISLDNFLNRGPNPEAVGGIALAMSIAYTLEFIALMFIFHYKLIKLDLKMMFTETFKKMLAGGVMFIVMYFIYRMWNSLSYSFPDRAGIQYTGSTTLNLAILTAITVATGIAVYILMSLLLKIEELKIFQRYLNPLFKKLRLTF